LSPGAAGAEPVAHWVAVRRRGACLAARTLRCRGDYRSAAAGTVLFGRSLAAGRSLTAAGVLVPEDAFTIGSLESELAESDIVVVDEQSQ
jgi:hypothetical protein